MKIIETGNKRKYSELEKKLIDHNYKASKSELLNPKIFKKQLLKGGVYLFDENKELVGGCAYYYDYYNWMFVDLLWVSESLRGNDYGTKLIQMVIQTAKNKKCIGVRLETWSFQAKGFYEKNGFTVYGALENHPLGITEYLMFQKFV